MHKKIIFIILAAAFLTYIGCSSSGDDGTTLNPTPTFNWAAGIYTGTFTETSSNSSGPVVLLVTSDNRFALAATDGSEYNIGTVSGSDLTTTSGFTATLTAALSGTFSDSVSGLSGSFTLRDAGLYDRTSDLSKLVGQWVDIDNTITYIIQPTGAFDATIGSCDAQGSFAAIDSSKNEYDFTMNVAASCEGLDEGDFTGLAFTDDYQGGTDNQIVIIAENPVENKFIISAPLLQE